MTDPITLYTIEEPQLRMMMQDPRIVTILPCLQGPKSKLDTLVKGHPNCPRCAAKIKAERATAIRSAMQCIQGARGSVLANLKAALNTKQIRMIIAGNSGKLAKITM